MASVTQSEVIGSQGRTLLSSGGRASPNLQIKFETEWGKPVKGREGIVGWMRSHGEVSKKVSDINIVLSLS